MIWPPFDQSWETYFEWVFFALNTMPKPVELDSAPSDIITVGAVRVIYANRDILQAPFGVGFVVAGRTGTRYFLILEKDWRPQCWVALDPDLFRAFLRKTIPEDLYQEVAKAMETVP